MKSFFKSFLAALLALFVFTALSVLVFVVVISALSDSKKEETGSKAVLVLDLSKPLPEIGIENPLASLGSGDQYDVLSAYDAVRLIVHAAGDSSVKGIYVKCETNVNGFGTSEEIREALQRFKKSGKFIIAYANTISQGAYLVAGMADKVYCNPQGGLDWRGYSMNYFFLKGTLQRLGIEPQIFYAGKFKSATEPFRETQMTPANRLQSTELLQDLYGHFLELTSRSRQIDTAFLRSYAVKGMIHRAGDAVRHRLVDGLRYDDEVKDEIRQRLKLGKKDKINFVPLGKYAKAGPYKRKGREKIAVIYAAGDIVDGKGDEGNIGSDTYVAHVRKARQDESIKAIVLRVNSGGGSSMASENIWRELSLARKQKPVVVSFGDVAASGGYYLSCNADSIFAQPNTITGSIGVFSIIPNMQPFFNQKLGVTFDGVTTAPDADGFTIIKPLTETQKSWIQSEVDSIYLTFTTRVADGRRKSRAYIDSVGQGRVWSGKRAVEIGLVDGIGGLERAIAAAASMAKVSDYRLREYPEPVNWLDRIFGGLENSFREEVLAREMTPEERELYKSVKQVRQYVGTPQARMPFRFVIE